MCVFSNMLKFDVIMSFCRGHIRIRRVALPSWPAAITNRPCRWLQINVNGQACKKGAMGSALLRIRNPFVLSCPTFCERKEINDLGFPSCRSSLNLRRTTAVLLRHDVIKNSASPVAASCPGYLQIHNMVSKRRGSTWQHIKHEIFGKAWRLSSPFLVLKRLPVAYPICPCQWDSKRVFTKFSQNPVPRVPVLPNTAESRKLIAATSCDVLLLACAPTPPSNAPYNQAWLRRPRFSITASSSKKESGTRSNMQKSDQSQSERITRTYMQTTLQ